jgi:N-acetyl-alpha-D-glucosaminyl L-malate synthase BshA
VRIGISCYPTLGGSGVVATELAMSLAAAGDDVHVISYAEPPRLKPGPRLAFHEVVVPHYPLFEYPPYSLALATKMVEVCAHQSLDLLHVHYAVPNAISAVLAREILAPRPLKVVTTLHGTDITLVGNDPNYLATTRFGILESDAVTAVSEWLKQETASQFGIEKAIEVVPNFIDPARYERARDLPGARAWARPGERILIHVSNFRPVKRVMDLIGVHERLRRSLPVRLILVGDGPERCKVEQYCRGNDLCDSVTFVGGGTYVIEELLVGADLFLLPSETESFGLAALEALSCEVPVIASRVGGLPEVVDDGRTGYLLPVGDLEGMAAAAARLLGDEPLRRAFGSEGRRRAVERFAEERIVERYRAVYRRVLDAA